MQNVYESFYSDRVTISIRCRRKGKGPSKAFTTGLTFAWLPYSTIGIEFFIISAQQDIPRDTFMWVLFKGVMDWRGNIEKLKY